MSAILGNVDFVKKVPGILKICQLVLGVICLSLAAHYISVHFHPLVTRSERFFLVTTVTYFTGTFLIIVSSLVSVNTETRLRQTLFEPLYHGFAFIMYFSGSTALLAEASSFWDKDQTKDGFLAAGSLGIINSILYALSTYDSYRAYVNE